LSTAVFAACVAAFFLSGSLDSRRQFVTVCSGVHVSMDQRAGSGWIYFFNDTNTGPFLNGIVSIATQGPHRYRPPDPVADVIENFAGIHYRMVRWRNGHMLRTLAVSMYYPLAFSTILPIVWLLRRLARPPRRRGFPVTMVDANR
jgi:hypothetical protein